MLDLSYRYTEAEQKKLLSSLKVLIDTRERENNHITAFFQKQGISWKVKKINFGDYSFYLPANPDLGILKEIYFTNRIVIERKGSLDELAGNLTHGRTTFENELIRANGCNFFLLVESGNWADVINGRYRSRYEPKSYFSTLLTYTHRYNVHVIFTNKEHAGQFITGLFWYYLREYIRG